MTTKKALSTKAVIYCRVSSDKQVRDGDGLQSQETSCREYARQQGYDVLKVFKDAAVSGVLMPDERPGMKALFAFLDTQKDPLTIIVDEVSRLARGHRAYDEFMVRVIARGATIVSPTHKFGTAPEEKFITDISVSMASFQREKNREQVKNRQHARLLNGFWTFGAPAGYKYVKHKQAPLLQMQEKRLHSLRQRTCA